MSFVDEVRADIPLTKKVVYFDNAATCLTPLPVVEAMTEYYTEYRGNIHRGVHTLSEKASYEYDSARQKVASLINAKPEEIIFVKNTTEALNMVALGLQFEKGDTVVTTEVEHHSNFLPFYRLKEKGVQLEIIEATPHGLLQDQYHKIEGATLVTCSLISNVLGSVLPVNKIGKAARKANALFCVDAAQAVGHMPVDVKEINCDFLAFSGHKGPMGPTGVGVLYIKKEVQKLVSPVFLGGGMITAVSLSGYELADPPITYEAGTPPIAEVIGLGTAVDYIQDIGVSAIHRHEQTLVKYTLDELSNVDIPWYGPYTPHAGVISFNVPGLDCHDTAAILDDHKIMVRSGHHCAIPVLKKMGISGTVRASYHCYNTLKEVERMVLILRDISKNLV
jgi:cysteine desulfurase/selenocysteine lyase